MSIIRPSLYINLCIIQLSVGPWIFESPTGTGPSWHRAIGDSPPPGTSPTGRRVRRSRCGTDGTSWSSAWLSGPVSGATAARSSPALLPAQTRRAIRRNLRFHVVRVRRVRGVVAGRRPGPRRRPSRPQRASSAPPPGGHDAARTWSHHRRRPAHCAAAAIVVGKGQGCVVLLGYVPHVANDNEDGPLGVLGHRVAGDRDACGPRLPARGDGDAVGGQARVGVRSCAAVDACVEVEADPAVRRRGVLRHRDGHRPSAPSNGQADSSAASCSLAGSGATGLRRFHQTFLTIERTIHTLRYLAAPKACASRMSPTRRPSASPFSPPSTTCRRQERRRRSS